MFEEALKKLYPGIPSLVQDTTPQNNTDNQEMSIHKQNIYNYGKTFGVGDDNGTGIPVEQIAKARRYDAGIIREVCCKDSCEVTVISQGKKKTPDWEQAYLQPSLVLHNIISDLYDL